MKKVKKLLDLLMCSVIAKFFIFSAAWLLVYSFMSLFLGVVVSTDYMWGRNEIPRGIAMGSAVTICLVHLILVDVKKFVGIVSGHDIKSKVNYRRETEVINSRAA